MLRIKMDIKKLIESNGRFKESGYLALEDYEKEMVIDRVYDTLFKDEILDKDDFIEILGHNFGKGEDYSTIDFNDEIISIEEVGDIEMFDIQVDHDHLYFASGILTHNSAYDNLESGLDSIADSLGVIQTADVVIALLSTGQLREMDQSLIKFLKNRNTGSLSSHLVEVDFSTVRFTDLDEDQYEHATAEVNSTVLQKAVEHDKVNTSVINFN